VDFLGCVKNLGRRPPWRHSSDSMIVVWPSASKSVQSIVTVMLDRLPTTYGTQWTSKASTSMPGLDQSYAGIWVTP